MSDRLPVREAVLAAVLVLFAITVQPGMRRHRSIAAYPTPRFVDPHLYHGLREPLSGARRVVYLTDHTGHEIRWRAYSLQYALSPVAVRGLSHPALRHAVRRFREGDPIVLEYADAAKRGAALTKLQEEARALGGVADIRRFGPDVRIVRRPRR